MIQKEQQSQQQYQGFTCQDNKLQLIDYKYQPSIFIKKPLIKKNQINIKHQLYFIPINNHPFINHGLRQQYNKQIIVNHKKNIVFNCCNQNDIGFIQSNINFDCSFQCGNLEFAIRRKINSYDLYMRPDTNTKAHFQWFFFKVKIKKGGKIIHFKLKNFIKSTMLYNKGLKPFYRSLKAKTNEFQQLNSEVKFIEQNEQSKFYTLKFDYNFEYDNDQIEFCSQPPYSLTRLIEKIKNIHCLKGTLCRSFLGNKIPYLIYQAKIQTKSVIVVIGRQHPGQAVSSWMMQGFIQRLKHNDLNNYIQWVIIPMLNVDGVIVGNNRTGLMGHDLNRNWNIEDNIKKIKIFPQIIGVLNLLKKLKKKYQRKLKLFLDFHGHSSQPNIFCYGPPYQYKSFYYFQSKIFPELLSRHNNNFNLQQCSYSLKQNKKSTARSILFHTFKVPFCYTIQSTFGVIRQKQATINDFIRIGIDIAQCACQFIYLNCIKQKITVSSLELLDFVQKKYEKQEQYEQFDSASCESQNTEEIKKFEKEVTLILDKTRRKKSSKNIKTQIKQRLKTYPQISLNRLNIDTTTLKCQTSKKKYSIDRFTRKSNTEINVKDYSNLQIQMKEKNNNNNNNNNNINLPNIKKHSNNHRLKFDDPITISMKEIEKRLAKLKNSSIGKKILVINAYGV